MPRTIFEVYSYVSVLSNPGVSCLFRYYSNRYLFLLVKPCAK